MNNTIYPSFGLSGITKNNGISGTTDKGKNGLDVYIIGGGTSSTASSVAGGGDTTFYAKPTGAVADGVSAYASATTITVTGLPFTFTAEDIVSIRQIPTTGGSGTQDTVFSDVADFSVSGTTITVTGATFAATDTFIVALSSQPKSYTSSTDSKRTEEIDSLDQKYVPETLLDLTNIATNTTGYGYIDMDGVKYVGIQAETSGATPTDTLTVTLEATVQDDGTAATSCNYQDVTNALTGSASFVDTDFIGIMDTVIPVKYLRVKYVTSNDSGNDADLTVYSKKLY